MKKCKRCLAENVDDAAFCENCGVKLAQAETEQEECGVASESTEVASLDNADSATQDGVSEAATDEIFVEAEPVVEESAAPEVESEAPTNTAAYGEQGQEASAGFASAPQPGQGEEIPNPGKRQPAGTGPQQAMSCEGILSQAWHDVRTSNGWFGKAALLALINLIPILNFVVYGYCLRWGRLASFKNAADKPMPPVRITGDYFKMGFFCTVINMCWGIVIGLISAIPFLGIIGIVLCVFAIPMIFMGLQRMNLLNNFGSAFQLKDIWEKYRRNIGGGLALPWLPSLLVLVVVLAIVLGMTIVFSISAVGLLSGPYLLKALGVVGMIAVLVASYIILMANVVASMVIFRAFGYWTTRVAPEWIAETYAAAGMTPPSGY